MNSISEDGLLTFDESSPLFISKKVISKRKPRKAKPKVVADVVTIEDPIPRRTRGKAKKKPINKDAPKYVINSPSDCKHISATFKKKLMAAWEKMENGNDMDATDVASYLRGVSSVKRPKEYQEFRMLIQLAKMEAERKRNE